ncbi:MAG: formylglycine-generating enzyme family protein [Chitinispirillia bacterium]|jgi:formylglycine-generating enzyme required for sulfatase activity
MALSPDQRKKSTTEDNTEPNIAIKKMSIKIFTGMAYFFKEEFIEFSLFIKWIVLKLLVIFKWILLELLGLRFIYRKIIPLTEEEKEKENSLKKRSPATFGLWFIGIYVAIFGLASQRYENRLDKIETKSTLVISQLAVEKTRRIALQNIGELGRNELPFKPELFNPFSTIKSMISHFNTDYEESGFLVKPILESFKDSLPSGIDLTDNDLSGADLTGAINITIEQLKTVKTLYKAKLDENLLKDVMEQCPEKLSTMKDSLTKQWYIDSIHHNQIRETWDKLTLLLDIYNNSFESKDYILDSLSLLKAITDVISHSDIRKFIDIDMYNTNFYQQLIRGMVKIAARGKTFQMGSNKGNNDEKPVHTVKFTNDFYIGKTEVTQREYEELMGENPSYFKGDNLPVETVYWWDAIKYCNARSRKEGLTPCYNEETGECNFEANGYRLPTEAEWEYASRGGPESNSYEYSGSDTIGYVAWSKSNTIRRTNPVGIKLYNEIGVFDMSGNVWEWCNDWYGSEYYDQCKKEGIVMNPKGPNKGDIRVLRGGSWGDDAEYCRSALRGGYVPVLHSNYFGFRLARGHIERKQE